MKILGIESSSLVASVAVVTEEIVTAEYTVDFKKTHSQTLLPMLDEIAKMLELDLNTIDAIAVAGGPGSFTGLRIGAATAKGLGLALKKPLIHVPTVDAMAYHLWGAAGLVCPIMDARRSQVYTGLYHMENGMEVVMQQCPMDVKELAEKLNSLGEKVIFLGDGVPVYRDMIRESVKVPYRFAPAHMNRQRASGVAALGMLAWEQWKEGKNPEGYQGAFVVKGEDFNPDYLRKSQAERQREAELSPEGAAGKLPGDY
jgi:tRNA threonylcarbamoyladenosine biosynthesis protein TsaB